MLENCHFSLQQLGMPSLGSLKDAEDTSYLISTCIKLQFKPIKEFSIEDLRIMLGQDIGTEYLLPLALEQLHQNILVEGDFGNGDLLFSVLSLPQPYWKNHLEDAKQLLRVLNRGKQRIKQHGLDRPHQKALDELLVYFREIF